MILTTSLFREELKAIVEEVNKHIKCDYVQRYVEIPSIPLLRMQVLFLFLHDSDVPHEQIRHYIVSTVLIQMGLDCHEEVTLLPQYSEKGIRNRQLSVLAGDFFSSKYYFLLAKLGDVALIKELARSIYQINEVKTKLYTQPQLSIEDSLKLRNEIDSALYTSFIPRFSADLDSIWRGLIEKFSLLERLRNGWYELRWGQAQKEKQEEETLSLIQTKIEQTAKEIKNTLAYVQKEEVKQGVGELLEAYFPQGRVAIQ
ncbi:heptaprenyl diphosphate synthase component 1 [Ammoniphilus sp. 3BR4]|uniref:heptaprenyl diphosphate synthase component 1 n=1 Tax=Ammoniphilus sp. 3BR4 TaxID=3158265 RepID=UPI003466E409